MKTVWMAIAALLALNNVAHAAPISELQAYIDEEVSTIEKALTQSSAQAPNAAAPVTQETWYLQNFWLRLKPRIGIVIPGFAKFQVVPEAEALFQRTTPEGWTAYKPVN